MFASCIDASQKEAVKDVLDHVHTKYNLSVSIWVALETLPMMLMVWLRVNRYDLFQDRRLWKEAVKHVFERARAKRAAKFKIVLF